MTHVAFLIPTLDRIGGAERQVLLLARGLLVRGWRVSVVALSGTGANAAIDLTSAGSAFFSLDMRKGLADPRGWLRLHHWLLREAPDVLHAHLPHAAWMARWSRLGSPVRVVVDTIHTSATGTLGRRLGYRASNWLPDRVTAVSRAAADAWLSARMVSPAKLHVLPNGIDVDYWRPSHDACAALRAEFGIGDRFLWLAAGRLDPVKDYPTLLRAMAALPGHAQLAILGQGQQSQALQRLARDLGIEQRVRFCGFEPDVRRWMQAANGFVLSSLWEGLPLSLLEAGACGLAAVATNVPGSREVLLVGNTGLLVPPADPAALASSMAALMESGARLEMGRSARVYIARHFSIESVLDRLESLYNDLLHQNPKPRRRARHAAC